MMMEKQPANRLYRQIKDDIQQNLLPIGTALRQTELSQRYEVSRIPIRDVLSRLRSEGWLTESGKRGVMIPPLSATEAEDLYLMRMYLEPLILTHAAPKLAHQTLGKAEDLLLQIEKTPAKDLARRGELNWKFHACLYAAAERPTLYNTIVGLHQQCSRYCRYQGSQPSHSGASQKEHYQLLEALKSKQLSKAKNILKAHISDAGETLVAYLLQQMKF